MNETFSQRLKKYRKAKNMTQQELAEVIGVSDKTVSRWESEGGYPDVTVLVPLARALGVTVDDLLDEKAPVRSLTRGDFQNLLSFAFALGGGALYFLLDLFMPGALCYLFYLGCLAYGAYLQRYYAYRSRWFLLGEGVVNLFVNGAFWGDLSLGVMAVSLTGGLSRADFNTAARLTQGSFGYFAQAIAVALCLTVLATGLTQYLVVKKGFGGELPQGLALGHREGGHRQFRLTWGRPRWRLLPVALAPLAAGLYWLPAVQQALLRQGVLIPGLRWQEQVFGWLLIALAVAVSLSLLKKGYRRWLLPAWATVALCGGMTGLRRYPLMWSEISNRLLEYAAKPVASGRYHAVGVATWGIALTAVGLCTVWLVLSCLRLEQAEE